MDLGPYVIIGVMVLGVAAFVMSLVAIAAAVGWAAQQHAEATHPGSELIDLNQ